MTHETLAEIAALVGAASAALVLLGAPRRLQLVTGLGLLAVAEAMLIVALLPRDDLEQLASAKGIVALVAGALAATAGAWAFVRWPSVVPVALLLAAPFRIPVELGSQDAFLLLPLYVVLAAASLALIYRAFQAEELHDDSNLARRAGDCVHRLGRAVSAVGARPRRRWDRAALLRLPVRSTARGRRAVALCRLASPCARDVPRRPGSRLRGYRPLSGVDTHARLRARPARRERLHDVLPRHLPLQGPEHLRAPARVGLGPASSAALARPHPAARGRPCWQA